MTEPPPNPPPPSHPAASVEKALPNPTRRFVQVFAAFLCFFVLVRTVALEPFGVPTGSMATALIGNHRTADCPRCGFPVTVGEPGPDARAVRFDACRCPNCGSGVDLSRAREIPGDRLMVDKTVYHARAPRRWEVAVFRCPADLVKPYVKRVVGLPGETLQLAGGDVYADGELLRKTLRQVRETTITVFDLNYAPEQGWADRWLVEPLADDPKLPTTAPRVPERLAGAEILRGHELALDGVKSPGGVGLTYRNWNLDTRAEEPVHDFLAYNAQPPGRKLFNRAPAASWGDPVHDFLVEFELEVVAGSGAFACRLSDGVESVRADFPIGELAGSPGVQVSHDGGASPQVQAGGLLRAGKRYRVEFAYVDRRATLALDGREVAAPLDLPADPVAQPRARRTARPVQLGVRGASVVVRDFRLRRDVHYFGAAKAPGGWRLGADEYFLLGDNTGSSHDSRAWEIDGHAAPGVPEKDFLGKPFLIHQPTRPAHVTVNGRERAIQSPDWGRIRWMR